MLDHRDLLEGPLATEGLSADRSDYTCAPHSLILKLQRALVMLYWVGISSQQAQWNSTAGLEVL